MFDVATVLKRLLTYDPETGSFTNLIARGQRGKIGAVAGSYDKDGYIVIQIGGTKYRAGRLAWLYMTGEWPKHEIDHIDGIRDNDSWSNLREATRAANVVNSDRAIGASGFRGVKYDPKTSTWRARIAYEGYRKYVGVYATQEEAYNAYLAAACEVHGEFALHNRPQPHGA